MNRQLTDDEARALRGFDPLPDPGRFGPWTLRGKSVSDLRLGSRPFGDLLWDDVHFTAAHWASGELRRAQLQKSSFTDSAFVDCVFEDVLFVECEFTNLEANGVQFRRCRFERCAFGNLHALGTTFDDCSFDATRLSGSDLRESTLQGCAWSGGELEFVRVARSRLTGCVFAEGGVRNCRFSYADTQDLAFERVEFDQTTFVGGEHVRVQISAARGSVLKFVSAVLRGLSVGGCAGFADLRLISSQAHDVELVGNPLLIGFSVLRSELTALHVEDSTLVHASFEQTAIGPSSAFEAVSFQGLSVSDSQLTRPQCMRCRFGDYLYLQRSQFDALVVDEPRYEAGLREVHEAVTYPNTAAHLGSRR